MQFPDFSGDRTVFLDYGASTRVFFGKIMRRTPFFFAFAGIELVRYFALAYVAGPFSGLSQSAPHLLRLITIPNLLYAVAFFFLALDRDRYEPYRPLLVIGKVVSIFSATLSIPVVIGTISSGSSAGASDWVIIAVAVWDIAAMASLVFWHARPKEVALPPSPEPELVETE
jgi:hypothetical protein